MSCSVPEESPFDGYVLQSPVCVLKNVKWIVVICKSFSVLRTALGVLWSFSTLCLKKDIHSFLVLFRRTCTSKT